MGGPKLTDTQLDNAADARRLLDVMEKKKEITVHAEPNCELEWTFPADSPAFDAIRKDIEKFLTDLGLTP